MFSQIIKISKLFRQKLTVTLNIQGLSSRINAITLTRKATYNIYNRTLFNINGVSVIELLSVLAILGMLGTGLQTWHQLTEKTLLNNEVANIESFLRSGVMLASSTQSDVRICPLSGKHCLNQVAHVDWNSPIGLFVGTKLTETLQTPAKPFIRTGPKITNFVLQGATGTQSGASFRVCRVTKWPLQSNQGDYNVDAQSNLHQRVVLASFGRIRIDKNAATALTHANNCVTQ